MQIVCNRSVSHGGINVKFGCWVFSVERNGIPIDLIAGTSIWAIVGAFYAAGKDMDTIRKAVVSLNRRQMLSLADFTIPTRGFIKGRKITEWLKSILGGISFQDLRMPFACVTTDISTGEEIIIKEGSVVDAVRASASIPSSTARTTRRSGREAPSSRLKLE